MILHKRTALWEIGKPGRVQVTKKQQEGAEAPRLIINRAKNRSYERSNEYKKVMDWNALGVEKRSTWTIEMSTKLIMRELNAPLD